MTYDMDSLIWQMEHTSDDYMIDNDCAPDGPQARPAAPVSPAGRFT